MGRYALLIGISNYNAGLTPLPSAVKDVDALHQVLLNPEIGGFAESDVKVLKDAEKTEIETEIYHLFKDRKNDDLLLFYFSGHGVTDSQNNFYLTAISTNKDALPPTALPSSYIHNLMNNTGNRNRSKHQVVILDCCHSGAFSKNAKGVGTVNVLPKLGGEGRAILTASSSDQYAFAQEGFELSLYTHFLVEGLKTGAADRDGNGEIAVDELYDYVRDKVRSVNDDMSPEFHPVKEGYRIILAKAALDDPKLKFRKEVEKVVRDSNGKISKFAKSALSISWKNLELSQLEAEAIIAEVIRPYEEYNKKLEQYEQDLIAEINEAFPFSSTVESQLEYYEKSLGLRHEDIELVKARLIAPKLVEIERLNREQEEEQRKQAKTLRTNNLERYRKEFTKAIESTYPLDEYVRGGLKSFQMSLGLSDRDVELIESPLISTKEADYQQKQNELEKLKLQAEQIKHQQEEAERLRLQQVAELERQRQENDRLERLRKQAEEEERLKRLQEEAERVKNQQQSKPAQPEFEFEFVKVRLVKESGFLGIGGGTKIELDRKKGKVQYIRENLGNGVTLDLVKIPAGKFSMGSNKYSSEQPIHDVSIKEFWMGKYAITNAQWYAVMGTKPSDLSDVKFQGENQPVINVSWDDATEFCKKLSQKINKKVRLPSEAEWEYACRAGTTTDFHFGETITPELVNYNGNYPYGDALKGEYRQKTVDVNFAKFSPNAWGLYQMHGNVWEWCEDVWHENYNGAPNDGSAWLTGGEQNRRALRGGSWYGSAVNCRSAYRCRYDADDRYNYIGFRVVL